MMTRSCLLCSDGAYLPGMGISETEKTVIARECLQDV